VQTSVAWVHMVCTWQRSLKLQNLFTRTCSIILQPIYVNLDLFKTFMSRNMSIEPIMSPGSYLEFNLTTSPQKVKSMLSSTWALVFFWGSISWCYKVAIIHRKI
jgi:hypothetical protein